MHLLLWPGIPCMSLEAFGGLVLAKDKDQISVFKIQLTETVKLLKSEGEEQQGCKCQLILMKVS